MKLSEMIKPQSNTSDKKNINNLSSIINKNKNNIQKYIPETIKIPKDYKNE